MTKGKLNGFFESFIKKDSLFVKKKALQLSYTPDQIVHRDTELNSVATILAPLLKMEKPSNLFVYGKTGTGKTLVVRYTCDELMVSAKANSIPVKIIYINCKLKKVADTEYRLVAQLVRELGRDIPATGLPTDEIYNFFFKLVDIKEQILLIVLDEIDQLIKKAGDEILYNMTRINSELKNAQISIVGISNDLLFADSLDPRIKSSLSEEELVFPPYNALQIKDILLERVKEAFKKGTIKPGVIEKCSAYAARNHGDARRALELLRVAGEIAERANKKKVELSDLDTAEEKIEKDKIIESVLIQPKQFLVVLYSVIEACADTKEKVFTGDVYDNYIRFSKESGLRPLTQRRVSDIICELDMLGIINAKVISKGRHGRMREITLSIPNDTKKKLYQIIKDSIHI
ncbi:orc1/cdc6 family replication initiation protein [Candidatus Woesearchaeota archaeon]|nr:orc1/cdc6 family replication initiation protein [Candidatus Woesearchaeota archaeon]